MLPTEKCRRWAVAVVTKSVRAGLLQSYAKVWRPVGCVSIEGWFVIMMNYQDRLLWDVAAQKLDVLVTLEAAVAPDTRPSQHF